jgi:hypothetical protein
MNVDNNSFPSEFHENLHQLAHATHPEEFTKNIEKIFGHRQNVVESISKWLEENNKLITSNDLPLLDKLKIISNPTIRVKTVK